MNDTSVHLIIFFRTVCATPPSLCLHLAKGHIFWGWGPPKMGHIRLKFELGRDFLYHIHVPTKFHNPTFSRSEVIVLANRETKRLCWRMILTKRCHIVANSHRPTGRHDNSTVDLCHVGRAVSICYMKRLLVLGLPSLEFRHSIAVSILLYLVLFSM